MTRLQRVLLAFGEILSMYRPVRCPGLLANYRCAASMFIAFPSVFLLPIAMSLGQLARAPDYVRAVAVLLALFHAALSPLVLALYLVLPLLGCRIRLHHPAAQTLHDIEQQLAAAREGESG